MHLTGRSGGTLSLPLGPTSVQGSRRSIKSCFVSCEKVNLKSGTKETNTTDCFLLLTALPGLP